jgi:hypothetical protein
MGSVERILQYTSFLKGARSAPSTPWRLAAMGLFGNRAEKVTFSA